jgi:uncharacterized protein YidB (DUF937 family)
MVVTVLVVCLEDSMGLMDVLNGMRNGPRGQATSQPHGAGGMSPLTVGLLAYLAYKAFKGGSAQTGNVFGGSAGAVPQTGAQSGLAGVLGGLLGAGASSSILTNGLGELMKRLQSTGQGDVGKSWLASGPNQPIAPDALARAAGTDALDALAEHHGLTREEVAEELAHSLPTTVDQLTPDGRMPSDQEAARWM